VATALAVTTWPAIATVPTRPAVIAIPARSAIASVTARAPVITTAPVTAAATMTVAAALSPRATVAAFTRLPRRTGVGQLFAGLLVDEAHRQAHLAALIDLEQLDLDLLAFAQDVADVLDPLVLDLGYVHQPVLAGH